MLSSSPSKIHEPLVTGVSPRLTDRRQRQELRNTSEPVGARKLAAGSMLRVRRGGLRRR